MFSEQGVGQACIVGNAQESGQRRSPEIRVYETDRTDSICCQGTGCLYTDSATAIPAVDSCEDNGAKGIFWLRQKNALNKFEALLLRYSIEI